MDDVYPCKGNFKYNGVVLFVTYRFVRELRVLHYEAAKSDHLNFKKIRYQMLSSIALLCEHV